MLKQIVDGRWFNPKAVVGFWPANAVGDDIRLFTGESRSGTRHLLRAAPAARSATAAPISASPISSRRPRPA